MAYNDFFRDINNCLGVSPVGLIRRTILTGDVNPVAIYAVAAMQVEVTIIDAYIIPTTAVGGGTVTINTDVGAGMVALTDAMVCAAAGTVARAALIEQAGTQNIIGPADAVEAVRANDGPGGDGCFLHLLFHLN